MRTNHHIQTTAKTITNTNLFLCKYSAEHTLHSKHPVFQDHQLDQSECPACRPVHTKNLHTDLLKLLTNGMFIIDRNLDPTQIRIYQENIIIAS